MTEVVVTEKMFRAFWLSKLWQAMAATGHGYRRYTLKRTPPSGAARWRGERREDKKHTTKTSRFLEQFASPVLRTE